MEKHKEEKSTLHIRNKHRDRYDFNILIKACPELSLHVFLNKYGDKSIDFSDPKAVKALNKALLCHFYQIKFWDIPQDYLCPPIPGRADYLHYASDLLASCNNQSVPRGEKIKVLDIGVGANCVYPIIGHQEYGWSFVGSDIDELAIRSARKIVEVNPPLKNAVAIRLQTAKTKIFENIIHNGEYFDLTICNPPFHASAQEALMGTQRKVRNLGNKNYLKPVLNFGGQQSELWIEGGELAFIGKMIEESKGYKTQCFWFTSLVSKSENLGFLFALLEKAGVAETRTNEMVTGNKITRIVAWTFLNEKQQADWVRRW